MTSVANMRTRIAEEMNRKPSDIIGSPSLSVGLVINREINSAVKHYESMRVWWTEVKDWYIASTVDGTKYYSLTSDFLKMDTLVVHRSGAAIPLTPKTWNEIVDMDRSIPGATGLPVDYVVYANQLRLFPVPDGAYSLVGAYIRRTLPTSLTGSYTNTTCHSPTSTASHNNRLGGWYEHGEELIRHRARAAVEINYLRDTNARTEAAILEAKGEPFLSMQEKQAFAKILDETKDRLASGRVRPYFI